MAKNVRVTSIPELQTAVNQAAAADTVTLANGMYTNGTLTIGTSSITVRAEKRGGVFLNGQQYIDITGNYVTFEGFQFTSGTIADAYLLDVYGSNNLLQHLNFKGYSAKKYISIHAPSQYNRVKYCNFENKPVTAPIGNLVHIDPDTLIPGYHTISWCSFRNMPGAGGDNGNECIRISNGATSTYISRTIVEYCVFENTGNGDSEAISVKCRENVLRYNTFSNNQKAMMVFRNGDNNVAYGNFFINAGGIRVKEANNIYCYNNYFENAGVGGTMDAVTYTYISPNLKNINFLFNTFVDCGAIDLGGTGPVNNTWANNIVKKSSGSIITGSSAGISWSGNIFSGTLGFSPAAGWKNADPLLVKNADGYYGLSPLSPAVDAAASFPSILDIANVDDDPFVLMDISRQPRPSAASAKDAGCDEAGTGETTNRPLKVSDVGPSYLRGIVSVDGERSSEATLLDTLPVFFLEDAFPNPFNPVTTIRFQLSSRADVTMEIYDMLGRRIITLIDGMYDAGRHHAQWDATHCSSGMYLYSLRTRGSFTTKRLLLLR
jgi:hypothetical protein